MDYMTITASGGGSFGVTTLAPTSKGVCTFVDTVIGVEKENMQDRLAVRVSRAASRSSPKRDQFCALTFSRRLSRPRPATSTARFPRLYNNTGYVLSGPSVLSWLPAPSGCLLCLPLILAAVSTGPERCASRLREHGELRTDADHFRGCPGAQVPSGSTAHPSAADRTYDEDDALRVQFLASATPSSTPVRSPDFLDAARASSSFSLGGRVRGTGRCFDPWK